jgi:nitroreductase
MKLEEAILARRSVRGYQPREVPPEILHKVFALAQRAPSGCNLQPWIPHVVSGASLVALRDKLTTAATSGKEIDPDWHLPSKYTGIYRDRQHETATTMYGAMGIARDDREGRQAAMLRNYVFFDAPHVVFIFLARPFDTREMADVGMYAQTLMLAMTAHGIASCAQGALSTYPHLIRDHLGLSEDHRLLFGISFGYEDTEVKANATRLARAALDEAVRFHR